MNIQRNFKQSFYMLQSQTRARGTDDDDDIDCAAAFRL